MEVLVPVDGLEATRETVEYAVRAHPDAEITVLHVLELNAVHGTDGAWMHGSVMDTQRRYADELFARAADTAAEHGGSITETSTIGSPVPEILATAEECDADHLVVGGCERSGLLRLLFGNVTEGVVRGASVPVTVVK